MMKLIWLILTSASLNTFIAGHWRIGVWSKRSKKKKHFFGEFYRKCFLNTCYTIAYNIKNKVRGNKHYDLFSCDQLEHFSGQ